MNTHVLEWPEKVRASQNPNPIGHPESGLPRPQPQIGTSPPHLKDTTGTFLVGEPGRNTGSEGPTLKGHSKTLELPHIWDVPCGPSQSTGDRALRVSGMETRLSENCQRTGSQL